LSNSIKGSAPLKWLPILFSWRRINYLGYFLGPTGFLALFSPIGLIALPEVAMNIFSDNYLMRTIYYQYTSAITPFVFLSLIFGINQLQKIWQSYIIRKNGTFVQQRFTNFVVIYLLLCTTISTWLMSPLPFMARADVEPFYFRHPSRGYLTNLAKTIPPDASVSATTKMAPHFTNRKTSYLFPNGVGDADYIIIQEGDWFELKTLEEISQEIRKLEKDFRYKRIYQKGSIEVFQKLASQTNH
jgi:uncharacterized membrane protein